MPKNDHLSKVSADGKAGRNHVAGGPRVAPYEGMTKEEVRAYRAAQAEGRPVPRDKEDSQASHWAPRYDSAPPLTVPLADHLTPISGVDAERTASGRKRKPRAARTTAGDHDVAEATAEDPPRKRKGRKLGASDRLKEVQTKDVKGDHQG